MLITGEKEIERKTAPVSSKTGAAFKKCYV